MSVLPFSLTLAGKSVPYSGSSTHLWKKQVGRRAWQVSPLAAQVCIGSCRIIGACSLAQLPTSSRPKLFETCFRGLHQLQAFIMLFCKRYFGWAKLHILAKKCSCLGFLTWLKDLQKMQLPHEQESFQHKIYPTLPSKYFLIACYQKYSRYDRA